jgi:hypothetical protein
VLNHLSIAGYIFLLRQVMLVILPQSS